MRARSWLVKQGLTKPGSRGRLSQQAKDALDQAIKDGVEFTDYAVQNSEEPKKIVQRQQAAEAVKGVKVRDNTVVYGIDPALTTAQEDIVIAFENCAGCDKPIAYCTHKTPKLPSWINSETYWERP